ncbi:type VI secretion system tip protein VgrG [Ascidiimonas sp. W6]|uniref:type VI secretion system tip protein VgrG n=1 Tax=Ascidiimonas meishanensis TaxID=3128903 RepID=UPI0030EC66CC
MPSSPIVEETNLVSFKIISGGSQIPVTYEVHSIRIEQYLNRIAKAEITIKDGDTAKQTFPVAESSIFKPGVKIEIKLGYNSKEDSIFKGIVVKQQLKVNEINGSTLHVLCKDEAVKLTINRKNNIFTDVKDSAVIENIIGESGLQSSIAATTVEHKEVVQYYATDWDFIINRTEINGMVVFTDSGKFTTAKPAISADPALKLQYGYDIIEFDGELDATYQYSKVTSTAWDMSEQAMISSDASEPTVNKQGNITGKSLSEAVDAGDNHLNTSAPVSQDDLKVWAESALLKNRLSRFKGTVTFQGSSKAVPNSTIQLDGLSERFNGNAFISGVVHTLDEGRWNTEVHIGLSENWFAEENKISAPVTSALIPGIKGLQTGVVKKIYDDPDNQNRVQVEIPVLGVDNETVWARLSTFYNGNGFGAFFMPEVNDEVILGFVNDDPRFPVILGSVYSTKIASPETPDEKNTIKTLITQSKLQIKFDDENKVITILTPGGNTMVFSDEDEGITITDQSNNKIQMNTDGILVESQSDLTLKASQGVTIQGTTVKVNGDQSIDATGGSVSVTGNQSTAITGTAECSVKSSGQVEVQGLMVKIN